MYAKLIGKVSDVFSDYSIVEVNGVGYKVEGITEFLEGEEVSIYTYTHVREQELRLFGFRTKQELVLFEKLLDVQGVGPKIAIKIINLIPLEIAVNAIITEDYSALKVPGLGEKLAKKIILDIRNKVKDAFKGVQYNTVSNNTIDIDEDLLSALEVLGFKRNVIIDLIKAHNISMNGMTVQDKIRLILKFINKK